MVGKDSAVGIVGPRRHVAVHVGVARPGGRFFRGWVLESTSVSRHEFDLVRAGLLVGDSLGRSVWHLGKVGPACRGLVREFPERLLDSH